MALAHFKWDGGIILIQSQYFDPAVDWYSEHMGWTCRERHKDYHGEKAFFLMPGGGQIVLKAVDSTFEHLSLVGRHDGDARFCFAVGDWDLTLDYFKQHGIKHTVPKIGPDGRRHVDVYAFDDTRITAVHLKKFEGLFPNSRLVSYADVPVRFGVTDLEASTAWYTHFLGLIPSEREVPSGYALLKGKSPYQDSSFYGDRVWLEKVKEVTQRTNSAARPYFYLEKETFLDIHKRSKELNIECSPIVGDPVWWAAFHFFDPNGNRINVSTCRL
ncbi:VOC family protein [Paenibacillus humicola]|uniref:VOC family protein n=1 Tax=Paenibacillus humicola TaxID=3110540 RepID=UPI00237AB6F3|nr:VOC family protein [Paenibacillus humicola]